MSSCEWEVQDKGISLLKGYCMFYHCFVFRLIQLTFNLNMNRILTRGPHFLKLASYGTKVIYGAIGRIHQEKMFLLIDHWLDQ